MPKEQVRDQTEDSVQENIRNMHVAAAEQHIKAEKDKKVGENWAIIVFNAAKPYLQFINSVAGVYILWVFLHFVSANLYVYYCAHKSFFGALMSPLLASSPHCRALRWVLNSSAQSIDAMWLVLSAWVCSKLALVGGSAVATTWKVYPPPKAAADPLQETPLAALQEAAAAELRMQTSRLE
jgi:hypothetical protein